MAVNLSPPLISSLSSLQPHPSINQSTLLEGLSEGAKIRMILVRHVQNIACNGMNELTSFWLPLILSFIFVRAVIWEIMNVDLSHHWEKEDWVKELTRKDLPRWNYEPTSQRISICHELWMILSCCININAYNAFDQFILTLPAASLNSDYMVWQNNDSSCLLDLRHDEP